MRKDVIAGRFKEKKDMLWKGTIKQKLILNNLILILGIAAVSFVGYQKVGDLADMFEENTNPILNISKLNMTVAGIELNATAINSTGACQG